MNTVSKSTAVRSQSSENLFGQWVRESGLSRQDVADRLGICLRFVNNLCKGMRSPSLYLAAEIESMTRGKVPCAFWAQSKPNARAHQKATAALLRRAESLTQLREKLQTQLDQVDQEVRQVTQTLQQH